jgi:serine/threonine protein kinase
LIAGTLAYVAPELIRGDAVTPTADIYSLAVIAYHLLCHRPPFAAATDMGLVSLHLRAEPPRASMAWENIPPALDDLLWAMLAKNPLVRPTLDVVEARLRDAAIALTPPRPSLLAFLARRPLDDPFGRPALPTPPFKPAWIGLAVAVVALTGLISAIV